MKHTLNLHPEPFALIKSGHKTIEMRLNDEKRSIIKPGDEIEFINRENDEYLVVDVLSITPYKSFNELYSSNNKKDLGYNENEVADPNDMSKYYTEEQIEKYGVLAIKIQRR